MLVALSLLACFPIFAAEAAPPTDSKAQKAPAGAEVRPRTLDWEELLPEERRAGHASVPPPPLHDYLSGESGPGAIQEMDFAVNKKLDGENVRLPGFVVPVELDASGRVSAFLLVPYFGACIHVPPPPPNQVVFVHVQTPFALESMSAAMWVTGRLSTQSKLARLGAAAYTLAATSLEEYKY